MGDDPRLGGSQWQEAADLMKIKHTTDTRWSGKWVPPRSPASYGGRWIDQGGLGTTGDIVPDRHGFAFSDPGEKARLKEHMVRDVHTDLTLYDWQAQGEDEFAGEFATGGNEEYSFKMTKGMGGGYVNVEAWLHEQTPDDVSLIDYVEDPAVQAEEDPPYEMRGNWTEEQWDEHRRMGGK